MEQNIHKMIEELRDIEKKKIQYETKKTELEKELEELNQEIKAQGFSSYEDLEKELNKLITNLNLEMTEIKGMLNAN